MLGRSRLDDYNYKTARIWAVFAIDIVRLIYRRVLTSGTFSRHSYFSMSAYERSAFN